MGDTMSGSWNAETYRARAEQWRAKAEFQPPGDERDACIALAEGYDSLATLIESECEGALRRGGGVLASR
jgi:hypothetical protein